MLRGTVVAKNGEVVGERGFGRYIRGTPQKALPLTGERAPGLMFAPR
jgi:hypothetical protein